MSDIFYDMMHYPIPQDEENFYWLQNRLSGKDQIIQECTHNNRSRKSPQSSIMSEYLAHIAKYGRLYKSVPFIEQIYLCNSITFNALLPGSDIDILIISKPGKLWLARAWSWLIFSGFGLKRFGDNSAKRFCLSFYIDREHINLYPIALQPYDIYLCYWVVHLVPLYSANTSYINSIYQSNHRITNFIPNIQLRQNINLGNQLIVGENGFKRSMEKIFGGRNRVARLRTLLIKSLWLPILHYKVRRLGEKGRGIVISDTMLKFYHDKRKWINYQYKQRTQPREIVNKYDDESLF